MENELKLPVRKRRRVMYMFREAATYRVPLTITKVMVYTDGAAYPICPRCDLSLDREYMSFCDRCGQKLNWDLFEYARICRPGYKGE